MSEGIQIELRRWALSRWSVVLELLLAAVFVVVGGIVTGTFVAGGAFYGYPLIFLVLWWAFLALSAVAWMRTAHRVELYPDGSLLVSAPLRTVHMDVERLSALRYARNGGQNRRPGFVIEGDGRSVRVHRRVVTRDMVDALRSGSPDMELPEPWW